MAVTLQAACRVCAGESRYLWSGELIGRSVGYFECPNCSYVQTEYPDWLDQAYARPINLTDTGIMVRNLRNRDLILGTLLLLGTLRGQVVDLAGGYGILVRLLRDSGVDARWADLHAQNLLAGGFEYDETTGVEAALATSFEALEHFVDPVAELGNIFGIANNLLCSTELAPTPTPRPEDWWYYGREHGQHIGFFRKRTLDYIARRFGKHLVTDGHMYHLFSERPLNRSAWALVRRCGPVVRILTRGVLPPLTLKDHEMLRIRR